MGARFKNVNPSGNFSVQIGAGGVGKFVQVTDYGTAPTALILPKISVATQRTGQTLSLQTTGLTGITSRQWKSNGSNIGGATGTTYSGQSENQQISCAITCDQGVVETPKILILHSHADPSHDAMDDAIISLVPHTDVTHTAIADGNWTNAAIWDAAEVPGAGAVVLIPIGRTVTCDVLTTPRMDRMRLDGKLTFPTTGANQTIHLETDVPTQTGHLEIGTPGNRVAATKRIEFLFSDRDYRTSPTAASNLNMTTDPTLIGRGHISLGRTEIYGAVIDGHIKTATYPLIGHTQVVLSKTPINWKVGDRIIIPGTQVHLDSTNSPGTNTRYDEERIITSFSTTTVTNDTVHFSGALVYNHHLHSAYSHPDIQPAIANAERSVVFRSESTVRQRRAHTMSAHHAAVTHVEFASFMELGRTSKMIPAGIKEGTNFKYYKKSIDNFDTEPLTSDSNLQSRYSIHTHFTGFDKAERTVYLGCYVEGNPGWPMVHHGNDSDFFNCTIYRYGGSGMVAERGDEIGGWAGNLVFGLETTTGSYALIKGQEAGEGIKGDIYKWGYCYAFRGRGVRNSDNMGIAGTWGAAFYHRSNTPTISPVDGVIRDYGDLKDLKLIEDTDTVSLTPPKYPLIHQKDNTFIGCYGGMGVVKAGSKQEHDVGSILEGMTAVCRIGHYLNYIGAYILKNPRLISMNNVSPSYPVNHNGVHTGEVNQLAVVNATTQGFGKGLFLSSGKEFVSANDFTAEDWRFAIVNHTSISDTVAQDLFTESGTPGGATCAGVTKIYGSEPTYLAYPEMTLTHFPFYLYDWPGGNNAVVNINSGFKRDTSDNGGIHAKMPKVWDNVGFGPEPGSASGVNCRVYVERFGYWTYEGNNIALLPLYIEDRLSGRLTKVMRAFKCTGSMASYTNNGAFVRSTTAPTSTQINVNVTKNVPVTFSALTGATVESGATAVLDHDILGANKPSFISAKHGHTAVNRTTGQVTYTPDPDRVGTDEMYVFVYDGRGQFVTTRIVFTVT